MSAVQIDWVRDATGFNRAAALFTEVMLSDPAYISHSEIQWGLSPDGRAWAHDVGACLKAYLAWVRSAGSDVALADARDESGGLLGAAIVTWEREKAVLHLVLQDLVVAPAARGLGVGAALVAFIEAQAKAGGAQWLFLESGARNVGAHAFFERQGFELISHTFAKRI